MAGQPSQAQTKAFGQKMKSNTTKEYTWSDLSLEQGGHGAQLRNIRTNGNRFPDRLLPSDPMDSDIQIRTQLTDADMISNARPLPYTEKEIQYYKNKRDAEEYAGYQVWLGNRFNLNDPANRQLFKDIAPSYFNRRKELIKEQIDLTSRYAQLRLMGPENEEDLQLQYLVETGRVKLPQGPIWDPMTWLKNQMDVMPNMANPYADPANPTGTEFVNHLAQYNMNAYQSGLFNPFKILNPQHGPLGVNRRNPADIFGLPNTNALGPFGAARITTENYGDYGGADLGQQNRLNNANVQLANWNRIGGAARNALGRDAQNQVDYALGQGNYAYP